MENPTLCNDSKVTDSCYSSTLSGSIYSPSSHCCSNRMNFGSCPRSTGGVKLTFFKRCLVILFLQIGCLALDHSTSELAYEEDEMRLIVGHQFPGEASKLVADSNDAESQQSHGNAFISFHPKFYDFKDSPVGMPRLGIVRVDNRLKDENLKLISISGNTVHFHSSFFADKIIGPGGNTTFEVVFLSRSEGQAESHLYIHTSKGMFKYHVRGFGLPNPYRLRPLVGARIPVNGSYEPLITMHNPHKTRIQVVEMLSSGTDFQLKLPDEGAEGGDEEGGIAWAIEPFQTKQVMKGSFQGKTEGNHTGYIKIRVNGTLAAHSEYLLVPVEVQVSSALGIYSPQDSLDFGHLVKSDKPKTLSLFMINAQRLPVNVLSVSVKGDSNPAVKIEFRPLTIEPDIAASTVIALVTFDASQIYSAKQSHGLIEIRSECGQSITVPFRATVLQGELQYNASSLGFFVKADNNIVPRNFSVRNNFSTAVAIYEISVSHPEIVRVDNFNKSNVIIPGEQKAVFTLNVNNKAELCDSPEQVLLTVRSNITNLRLPITCYDGKLQLHTVEDDELDFGVVEMHTTRTEYFAVDNKNPVEIRLKSWGSNSTFCNVDLVGMQKGVKEDLAKIKDFDSLKKSLFLQPEHMAVFSIEVRRPIAEGMFWGESYVTTDHNQTLHVPFRFAISKGSVHSDVIYFDKAFPGKISSEKLHLSSSFNHTVSLRGLRSHHSASMWFTPSTLQDNPEVLSHRKNYVGKVHFDTRKFCGSDCYAGFQTDSTMGKDWVKGISLNWETGVIDWEILSTLQTRFEHVKDSTVSNVSLWLETTTELGEYKVATRVSYTWPRLSSSKMIVFPLTALGNESIVEIPISNPSSFPLVVQAILAAEYGPMWTQFVQGVLGGGNTTEGHSVFFLEGVSSSSSHSNSSVIFAQVQKQLVQDVLGVADSPGVSFFLPPGAKFLLRTKFRPLSKEVVSTVILLRNNLTGVEPLWIKGRAGTGLMTVGNGTPGSSLLFQITEKLLQACQSEPTNKYVQPQLTVRRSFVARNVGEIPLDIEIMEIYPPQTSFWPTSMTSSASKGDACEGYGFRILNCHPFTLQPNHTHSIDIAFTPDFTMAKIIRSLRLTDSTGGLFNYSLVAMVPSGMLSICSAIISRPSWEPILKYLLLIGIILGFVAAALMAYFEAGSVVSSTVVATIRVVPTENRPGMEGGKMDPKENVSKLDLKAVYDKVDNRFKCNQKEMQQNSGGNSKNNSSLASSSNQSYASGKQPSGSSGQQQSDVAPGGALRNRKKKHSTDSLNSNKMSDKTNTQPKASLSLIDISKGCEETSTNNNNNNNNVNSLLSKKDKENTPSNNSSSSGGGGKKKKNNNNGNSSLQSSQNSGTKKKCGTPDNFSLSNLNKSAKTEEETSSTTTESSNPDDLAGIGLFVTSDKERKLSEKGTGFGKDGSTTSNSGGGNNNKRRKEKSATASSLPTKDNIVNKECKESVVGISIGISPVEQLNSSLKTYTTEDPKKKTATSKKKDGGAFPNNGGRGSISPKPEMALWDSPRQANGDDFTELAAATEAFIMQRPQGKRVDSSCGSELLGGMPPTTNGMRNVSSPNGHAPVSMQFMNSNLPMSHLPLNRNRGGRGIGVIGQPRISQQSLLPPPLGHHHPNPNYGSIPGGSLSGGGVTNLTNGMHRAPPVMTTMANSMHMSGSGRQHTPPNSNGVPLASAAAAAKWHGGDILPDNGCDIWKRMLVDNSFPQYRTYGEQQQQPRSMSEMGYPTGGGSGTEGNSPFSTVGGFTSPNPPGYNPQVSAIGHGAQHNYSSRVGAGSAGVGNEQNNKGGTPITGGLRSSTGSVSPEGTEGGAASSPYMAYNGELTSEVINNLWQLNSSFEPLKTPAGRNSGNFASASSSIGGPIEHQQLQSPHPQQSQAPGQKQTSEQNYLQRMRSDPTPRQRTYSNSTLYTPPPTLPYYGGGLENSTYGHAVSQLLNNFSRARNNSLDATKMDSNLGWTTPASSAAGSTVPLSTSPNVTVADTFSEWGASGGGGSGGGRSSVGATPSISSELGRDRDADIWESVSSVGGTSPSNPSNSSSKWSTSYGTSPLQNNFTDSVAVGSSRSHLTPRASLVSTGSTFQESGFRKRVEMAQSQREVEAGLGFNPFTSDIWNQSEPQTSWGGNYRYSSNE